MQGRREAASAAITAVMLLRSIVVWQHTVARDAAQAALSAIALELGPHATDADAHEDERAAGQLQRELPSCEESRLVVEQQPGEDGGGVDGAILDRQCDRRLEAPEDHGHPPEGRDVRHEDPEQHGR
eukprot:2007826-Prymnesium_polylepis.1